MNTADGVRVVRFEAHLTAEAVESQLRGAFPAGPVRARVIVDCRDMTGYAPEARDRFVAWFRTHRHSIERTAVVTDNSLWHMVVRAMALAAMQQMRPFDDLEAARAWAES